MDLEKAKKYAVYLLSSKMYTCYEIQQKLIRKGYSEDVSIQCVEILCEAGILNDEQYASFYVHDSASINLKGMYRIKQELLKKGIASSVIDKAIAKSDVDTRDLLTEYVKIRFADKTFSDRKDLEKAKAHLLRRGFGYSEINECFKSLGIKISGGDWD